VEIVKDGEGEVCLKRQKRGEIEARKKEVWGLGKEKRTR